VRSLEERWSLLMLASYFSPFPIRPSMALRSRESTISRARAEGEPVGATCEFFELWHDRGLRRITEMTASTLEHTVLPPTEPLDELVAMLRTASAAEPSTTLSGPNGQHLILPAEVFEVLRDIVEAMAAGQAVTIAPVHQRLTTQEAADLLGVSRPTLVKLLEAGDMPFEQPGRHRRVRLADVLAYRERSSLERRAALDRMVEIADEADMYERTATPKRTR
jgi:excisionase family DNA binding protein